MNQLLITIFTKLAHAFQVILSFMWIAIIATILFSIGCIVLGILGRIVVFGYHLTDRLWQL